MLFLSQLDPELRKYMEEDKEENKGKWKGKISITK